MIACEVIMAICFPIGFILIFIAVILAMGEEFRASAYFALPAFLLFIIGVISFSVRLVFDILQ